MATTRKYLNHLLQTMGITPACSEEERVAAEDIARIFSNHGFDPEIQEFNASNSAQIVRAALGVMVFIGALFMGIGGALGVVGVVLAIAAGVVYQLERMRRVSFSDIGGKGLSQNVIAYHKASGPLASPRNRPVVVVAHYDSPRADLFARLPYASYRPIITKLLPYAMLVPAIIAVLRVLPISSSAKVVLWLVALVVSLVPLAAAAGVILNRFILPYTSGSICNKSSVAALLGVMDAVAPFNRGNEFPDEIPFEEFFSEQIRQAEDSERAAVVAAGDVPEDALGEVPAEDASDPDGADMADELQGTAPIDVDDLAGAVASMGGEVVSGQASQTVPPHAAALRAPAGAPAPTEVDVLGDTAAMSGEQVAHAMASTSEVEDAFAVPSKGARSAGQVPPIATAGVEVQQGAAGGAALRTGGAAVQSAGGAAARGTLERSMESEPAADAAIVSDASPVMEAGATSAAIETSEAGGAALDASGEPADTRPRLVNALGNYRFGEEVIRGIGMVPESCIIKYVSSSDEAPASSSDAPATGASTGSEMPAMAAIPVHSAVPGGEFDGGSGNEFDAESHDEPVGYQNYGEPVYAADEAPADEAPFEQPDDPYADELGDEAASYDEHDEHDRRGKRIPVPHMNVAAHAGELTETLSAVGAGAAHLFRKGKSMLSSVISHEHVHDDVADSADEYDDMPAAGEMIEDALSEFDGSAPDDVAVEQEQDAIPADGVPSEQPTVEVNAATEDDESAAVSLEATQSAGRSPDATRAANLSSQDARLGSTVALPSIDNVIVMESEPAPAVSDGARDSSMQRGKTQAFPASVETSVGSVAPTVQPPTVQTQAVQPQADNTAAPTAAQRAGAQEDEAINSLMAEISRSRPAPRPAPRAFVSVPDPAAPSTNQSAAANRSSLFDLPDPGTVPVDPFAPDSSQTGASQGMPASGTINSDSVFTQVPTTVPSVGAANDEFDVITADGAVPQPVSAFSVIHEDSAFETISADESAPASAAEPARRRGVGKLFHRKRREETSMSDWLGVDDDFDAKNSGRDIGSWDNFEGDSWKGGATSVAGASEEDLRDAVTSLGDDELLGHDIWFVATGASEYDNAGMQAFLDTHRDKLRGVFLINLESIGAGTPTMLATEGGRRVLKGDKRIMNLVGRVSSAFHRPFDTVEMPFMATDAYRAMDMSLRSLTIAGVEGGFLACARTEEDLPYRVNEKNVRLVADVVTEVIRRS